MDVALLNEQYYFGDEAVLASSYLTHTPVRYMPACTGKKVSNHNN